MGFFDLFKKQFWADVKKDADNVIEAEKNLSPNAKISFLVRYKIAFKGKEEQGFYSKDVGFKNLPCYNSKLYDGEVGNCQVCAKVMELDKFWSRSEIETLSSRLGYSVFDNVGGTVDENGLPNCACCWESTVVTKK